MADSDIIGKVGEVVLRVRGQQGPGEIITAIHGMQETFIAYADAPIECGAQVLVISVRGPRTVNVIAWNS